MLNNLGDLGSTAFRLAHDIQSPLTALRIAVDTEGLFPERRRALILGAIDRIVELTDQFISITKNKIESDSDAFSSLPALIEEVVTEKRLLLFSSKVRIVWNCEIPSLFLVNVPSVALKSIVSNLVDNAVHSIQDTGTVLIDLMRDGDFLKLTVWNDGTSISERILGDLGQRPVASEKIGGHGCGLFLASQQITRWGGTFRIDSDDIQGTKVEITLPVVVDTTSNLERTNESVDS